MVFVLVLAACPQRLDGREQAAFRQQHAAGDAGLNRCYAGGFAGSTDLTATRAHKAASRAVRRSTFRKTARGSQSVLSRGGAYLRRARDTLAGNDSNRTARFTVLAAFLEWPRLK
jgi:hypothetical protein